MLSSDALARPGPDRLGTRGRATFRGRAAATLQEHEWHRQRAHRLERENRQLQEEIRVIREELAAYRAERVEVADTLRLFAEHVTQLATRAIERLGKRDA